MRRISNVYVFSQSKVLLTGMQPTGNLHIGNYLGSIANMLKYQEAETYQCKYLMIADYHSLTTAFTYDHDRISYNQNIGKDSFQMAKILLACGVDPKKMCLFLQSQIPAHLELSWIFSCLGPQHWLNTMIQYKQKSHENSSVGLFTYPILMAVDILLYKATHVPVGVDQLQHIELTNKYADRFNKQFGPFFPRVKYVEAQFPKVMSFVDPSKKMSKSDANVRSRIALGDNEETVRDKIRRAVTDSLGSKVSFDSVLRPGLSNLLMIYSAFTHQPVEQICSQIAANNYGISQFKQRLTTVISARLKEIQLKLEERSDDEVRRILEEGAQRASQSANAHIKEIKHLLKIYV